MWETILSVALVGLGSYAISSIKIKNRDLKMENEDYQKIVDLQSGIKELENAAAEMSASVDELKQKYQPEEYRVIPKFTTIKGGDK